MTNDLYTLPHTIQTLSTQTKVRRLGYLTFIIKLFEIIDSYPINFFPQKVEIEAEKLFKQLEEYKNFHYGDNKGVIKATTSGISAKYYLNLAEGLKLLTISNRNYILSKQGRLFLLLLREYSTNTEQDYDTNTFILSFVEKIFYIKQILINDPIYFFTLIELIKNNQDLRIDKKLRNQFYDKVLENIKSVKNSNLLTNRELKELSRILSRIENWKEKEKYLEHILEPRINWLLDIGLIDPILFHNKILKLSIQGEKFYLHLIKMYQNFNSSFIINNYITQNYFFKLISNSFNLNYEEVKDIIKFEEQIDLYIRNAFLLFKTLAPLRVNAYQSIYYTAFMIFLNQNKIMEFNDVKKYLEKSKKYSLEWFSSESDGSLKIIRG